MPKIKDIVGHQLQLEELEKDIATQNVSHAYLLAGPRHIGKMTIAHWFASKLLLDGLTSDEKKATSKNIEKLTHPDLLVIDKLWAEGKCEDLDVISKSSNVSQAHRKKKGKTAKTDTISIDDIRSLQDRLHDTCLGKWRCCIIRSVERMKAEAANSFLKILEEPPPKLVFVLTTQSLSSLLPTVVSRTRILRCHSVPQKDLYPLVEGLDSADSSFILHLAQGAPGVIDRFRNHPEELVAEKQLQSTARQFWDTTSLQKRLYILQALKNKDKESDALLFHLALALREQPISVRSKYADSFFELLRNKKTNAQAQLLSQNFVLALGS